jgi:hypothetical protein
MVPTNLVFEMDTKAKRYLGTLTFRYTLTHR